MPEEQHHDQASPGLKVIPPENLEAPVDQPEIKEQTMTKENTQSQSTDTRRTTSPSVKNKPRRFNLRWFKTRWGIVTLVLLFFLLALGSAAAYTYSVAMELKTTAMTAKLHAQEAYASLKSQDLVLAKDKLLLTKQDVDSLETGYRRLAFMQFTPLTWHYADGQHVVNAARAGVDAGLIMVDAIEPYADVIGFKGQGSFSGGTAEDRIVKMVETLDKVNPSLDQVLEKINYISAEIDQVDPSRYPFEFQGQKVGDLIVQVKEQLEQGSKTLTEIKPVIKVLPSIAGVEQPKKYLILFQNDAEIRPTGGFMTAYAVLKVEKGKVSPEKSDDIYELDNKFTKKLAAPQPLQDYLLVKNWNLRDMNMSPDFKVSMDTFMPYYNELKGESKVDGVIAIDTSVLTDLVNVLGAIEVPGFGTFSPENDPRCDCPQIIYELEDIIGKPTPYLRSDRKAILGPMMQTILLKAYGAPKQQWPDLFQTIWKNVNEKHVLFYLFDETAQQAVETSNFAGRIKDYDGDYLHISDSNLGGAKSNLFVSQEVEQEVTVEGGKLKKTVTVIYKNPFKGSNCNLEAGQLCLNGILRDWVRFYVPKGSELVETQGFEEKSVKTSEELNKTVFEGFFKLAPQSQAKIQLTYTVPVNLADEYRLLFQKQPGDKDVKSTLVVNQQRQTFDLSSDKEIIVPLK